MREALKMSSPMISENSINATSSRELESGVTRSDLRDGLTIDGSGLEVVHANLSARQAKEKGLLTSGISGPRGSGSFESVSLTQSLASKLRVKTDLLGSTLFRLIWKVRITPSGRQIPALRASVHRTSGRDCTSWQSPDNNQRGGDYSDPQKVLKRIEAGHQVNLNDQAVLSAWPTPQSHDDRKRGNTEADHHYFPHDLPNAVEMASWPSPMAGSPATETYNEAGNTDSSRKTVALIAASWNSPKASADKMGRPRPNDRGDLQAQAFGVIAIGSPASTEKPGQLSPEHSRWLMGIPIEWGRCAVTVIRSSLRKRKPSSKPI